MRFGDLEGLLFLRALVSRVQRKGNQGVGVFVKALVKLSHGGLLLQIGVGVPVQGRRGYTALQGGPPAWS